MIKSMTGYGKGTITHNGKTIIIEIKTLNSKQADINLKTSCTQYKSHELNIRNKIIESLERGKIDCTIQTEFNEQIPILNINPIAFASYYKEIEALAEGVNASKEHILNYVLQIPEIMNSNCEERVNEDEIVSIFSLLENVLNQTNAYRIDEGKHLEGELSLRIGIIEKKLQEIEPYEKERINLIKDRLNYKLKEIESELIDKNRFEQEIIYYLEKLDITEEKTRLKQHLNYFILSLNSPKSEGRKLGFIAQEIGREINTLGSKSQDANLQRIVVEMKDELEKIKEQILNIL